MASAPPAQRSLSDISAGALPEPEAVRLASELAEAMAAAHQHGVIHRDLKPENLRVAADGRLKVLDFGVAKLVPPKTQRDLATSSAPLASTTDLETFLLQEGIAGTARRCSTPPATRAPALPRNIRSAYHHRRSVPASR